LADCCAATGAIRLEAKSEAMTIEEQGRRRKRKLNGIEQNGMG
jgi:hypothetical protein